MERGHTSLLCISYWVPLGGALFSVLSATLALTAHAHYFLLLFIHSNPAAASCFKQGSNITNAELTNMVCEILSCCSTTTDHSTESIDCVYDVMWPHHPHYSAGRVGRGSTLKLAAACCLNSCCICFALCIRAAASRVSQTDFVLKPPLKHKSQCFLDATKMKKQVNKWGSLQKVLMSADCL